MRIINVAILFLFGLVCCDSLFAENSDPIEIVSPNGRIKAAFDIDEEPFYSLRFDGKTIIEPSKLGLIFKGEKPYGKFEIKESSKRSEEKEWEYPWGRQKKYLDKYNETIVVLQETGSDAKRTLVLEFRAYDDGIAFRYGRKDGNKDFTLESESTEFNFSGDPIGWYTNFGSHRSSQEKEYPKNYLSTITPGSYIGCPIVAEIPNDGPYVALTEADLWHSGGLYFDSQSSKDAKTVFESGVMKSGEKAKTFDVSVKDAARLCLFFDDGGDGMNYDHADWVDMVLVDKDGKKTNLSELKPLSVTQGWGQTRTNRSSDGNELSIADQKYKTGFGSHSPGSLVFDLSGKYERLSGACGVDDEVTQTGTVGFRIETSPKAESVKLRAKIAPRRDGDGVAKSNGAFFSAWRLIIVAPKAIDLIEQSILMNVSRASDPNVDWSWIKPGIGSWDWWSDSNANMNTETIKHFISFASEMGWEYTFVDDPWYAGKKYGMGDPRNNILKGSDDVDIEEVVRFAKEKNVRLFLWLNWKDFDRQMDEALALYEKWGIAGLKIDFMDCDDQEMVEWYDTVVRKAAKHKLLVDFHGSFKPTGYRRAFPNLITREGIYGNEQNKWTRLTPEHYCTLPYTRLMLGPGDFTPGAFINRHYDGEGSQIRGGRTAQGIGTRAHELAISMLYDSPILCLCDRPEVYKNQPGIDYYRGLPTVWDESKGVEGEIGEYFSMIRRSGKDWYYAAITNREPRTLELKLDFLGEGEYEATIYADTEGTETDARKIKIETKKVTSKDVLEIKMTRTGGQAIVFKKGKV